MTAFWPLLDTPTTKYTVQPGVGFIDPGYLKATGSQHESVDLNAVTGRDTDLGDPVHAADGGTVTHASWHASIGGIVLIEHPDGSESHYWHLRDIHVRKGQYVNGGDLIGQIGKGGRAQWWAHLHFGVRKKAGQLAPDYWPSTHLKDPVKAAAFIREHYHDPEEWLRARGAKRTLADLQAQRGEPTRVSIVRGEALEEVTGKLIPMPERGVSLDARTAHVKVYLNSPTVGDIPATPLK